MLLARRFLLPIHGVVRAFDQLGQTVAAIPFRNSDGSAYLKLEWPFSVGARKGVLPENPLFNSLELRLRSRLIAAEQKHKFVSPPASRNVSGTNVGPHFLGELHQQSVSDGVAVHIIHL